MFWKKKKFNIRSFHITSSSLLLVLLLAAVLILIIVIGPRPYKGGMQVGDIARRTIKAPFDFYVQTDIDKEATEENREKAREAVNPVYSLDKKKNDAIYEKVDYLFKEAAALSSQENKSEREKAAALKEAISLDLKNSLYSYILSLNSQEAAELKNKILEALYAVTKNPIVDPVEKVKMSEESEFIALIFSDGSKQPLKTDSLLTTKEAEAIAKDSIVETIENKEARQLSEDVIAQVLSPNITYNNALTAEKKDEAAKQAALIYHENLIKENSVIVAKSQLITKDHISYLNQLSKLENQKEARSSKIYYYYSISIFVLLLTLLLWMYMRLYEPKTLSSLNNVILIGLLSLLVVGASKLIILSPLSRYFIPLASVSILVAILLNNRLAIILTLFLSIFIAIISGGQLNLFIYYLVGGLIGIYSVKNVRRRAQLLKAGLFVGLVGCLTVINIDFLDGLDTNIIFIDSLWAISNGFVCAFIVTGILPVLEYIFKITTNISLLELSDLNHPLLKEMVIKAPGTYHHSLIVGNLAENAADAIGANSLLARVGAYYHDIGKLLKPEYFSENQMGYADKHAELSPKMSSLIITNHIKDGLDLARKYKLSLAIKDFIQQHHGNSMTFYFYQRALEKESKEGEVKEEEFRYRSPLPQTKEVAIVLLADSVEAATRALPNQTPKKIKQTVQKIINNKFIDGQLDECDLTLKDLHKISESFSKLLAGIYHSRIEYPDPEAEEEFDNTQGKNGSKNKSN
jgi:hypothetical protein